MPLYMVVERFRNAESIYRRLRESGRMMPEGLTYVSSWIDERMEICFQLMETADRSLFDQWIVHWADLMEFEIYPVMSSAEAARRFSS